MRRKKRIPMLLLAALFAVCLLCGCEQTEEKMVTLSGTWSRTLPGEAGQVQTLLAPLELFPEEQALLAPDAPELVEYIMLDSQGNYRFGYDTDAMAENVKQFYEAVADALYEGRAALNTLYRQEFDGMSREEFNQFLAELYSAPDYPTMINRFVAEGFSKKAFEKPLESGSYTVKGSSLLFTAQGQAEPRTVHYTMDGSSLILSDSDTEVVYTK